jgi:uncharacterized membrane protein HdeD (DUF308 family)
MKPVNSPSKDNTKKADAELLFKSILCALIGLAVLVAPSFMSASGFRATVASASLVGWFALVLGCAFGVLYAVRRAASAKASGHPPH